MNELDKKDRVSIDDSRILFNTQYHWYYSWLDYTLAASLELRGSNVCMLGCDGLPYCEQELFTDNRPSCKDCYRITARHFEAFNLEYMRLSELLSEKEKVEASNIAYSFPIKELRYLIIDNVKIGEIAYRNLVHYYKGIFEIEGDVADTYRRCVESALLICAATKNAFSIFQPDKVVSPNGKFIQSGIAIDYAETNNIPYYTWDVFTQHTATSIAKNEVSHNQGIDSVWEQVKNTKLTDEERARVYRYYKLQSKSENTPYKYYDESVISDHNKILAKLSIPEDCRVISLFPNVEWDSTAMGMDCAFSSMHDWVFKTIEYAINNKDMMVIVRAHPGEIKVPISLRTSTPICDVIRDYYTILPGNIKLIDPTDNISSYSLCDISDAVVVYTSTMGIEFALNGVRPWVAAKPYYRGKGFTVDLLSCEHMCDLLDNMNFDKKLSKNEIELAEKLAYTVRYRRLFSYPFFIKGRFKFETKKLLPDVDPVMENVCQYIYDKREFLDIGKLDMS